MEELIKFDLFSNEALVAHVSALSYRCHEFYDFTYAQSWLHTGYPIDPTIEFSSKTKNKRNSTLLKRSDPRSLWSFNTKEKTGDAPPLTKYLL